MSIPVSFMLPLPYHAILNSFISVAVLILLPLLPMMMMMLKQFWVCKRKLYYQQRMGNIVTSEGHNNTTQRKRPPKEKWLAIKCCPASSSTCVCLVERPQRLTDGRMDGWADDGAGANSMAVYLVAHFFSPTSSKVKFSKLTPPPPPRPKLVESF